MVFLKSKEVRSESPPKYVFSEEEKEHHRYIKKCYDALLNNKPMPLPRLAKQIESAKETKIRNRPVKSALVARRRALRLQATPVWVDPSDFLSLYKLAGEMTAKTGIAHHVDHIVPLQGETVCGLHVPWNLRVIPASENSRKSNRLIEELL